DSIIKKGVEAVGPKATQVDVRLEGVNLSLLGGHGTLNGLFVGNPAGYKSESAMKVGTAHLALDAGSLMSDKVVIRSLRIESPEITFEGGLKENNLTQIQKNVQAFAGMTEAAPAGEPAAEPGATKKLQVDEFVLSGAKVNVVLTSPVSFTTSVKIADIRLETSAPTRGHHRRGADQDRHGQARRDGDQGGDGRAGRPREARQGRAGTRGRLAQQVAEEPHQHRAEVVLFDCSPRQSFPCVLCTN
ncbi:MAG: hypothetical protein HC841_09600, partial [Verrucomicrobiae bacterium]|nr:hypothetical protein [Verrucomicrobiae bacterium]